jgi:hypothetical protein
MIAGMDWLTTIPLIIGDIGNMSAFVLETLAERLLTIFLAVFIIGGISIFAITAFAWLWIKRAIGELHAWAPCATMPASLPRPGSRRS